MQQLKKAQASISAQLKQQQAQDHVVENQSLMDQIKMRPSTPVFRDFKRDDDAKDEHYTKKIAD